MATERLDFEFVYFEPRWLLMPNAKLSWVDRLSRSASIHKMRLHCKVRQEL